MHADLVDTNVDWHDDLVRNIPGIAESQHLFDDLSDDPGDWAIAIAAEGAGRIPTSAALITRPFDYGSVISYSFDSAQWQATRFSDATRYGVWYGSLDIETTVYETAWHRYNFLRESFPEEDRSIRSDRRVCTVRCDALLLDLRGKERAYPELVSRTTYAFTQDLGNYVYDQNVNGLLVRSARCTGINAPIFGPERLSNVRDQGFLTYYVNVVRDTFLVQRTLGTDWMTFSPSSLG